MHAPTYVHMISVKKAALMAFTGLFMAVLVIAVVIAILQTYDGENLKALRQDNLAVAGHNRTLTSHNGSRSSTVENLERQLSERDLRIIKLETFFAAY